MDKETLYEEYPACPHTERENNVPCFKCVLWKKIPGYNGLGICPKITYPKSITPALFVCGAGVMSADS